MGKGSLLHGRVALHWNVRNAAPTSTVEQLWVYKAESLGCLATSVVIVRGLPIIQNFWKVAWRLVTCRNVHSME